MKRKCYWCGGSYDTRIQSSVWCERNPNRGRGAKLVEKKIVCIGVIALKPNPWVKEVNFLQEEILQEETIGEGQ